MKTVETIENVILQIIEWKNTHPEAIQELLKLEQKLAELLKPGVDGTLASSVIGIALAKLASSGMAKYWIFPVVFAAGAISAVSIYGLFKWILSTKLPTPTSSIDVPSSATDTAIETEASSETMSPPIVFKARKYRDVDFDGLVGIPEDSEAFKEWERDNLVGIPEDGMYDDAEPIPTFAAPVTTPTSYLERLERERLQREESESDTLVGIPEDSEAFKKWEREHVNQ